MFSLPRTEDALPGGLVHVFGSKNWSNDLGALAPPVIEQQLEIYTQAKADAAHRGNPRDSAAEVAVINSVDSLTSGNPSEHVKTILAIKNPLELADDSICNWEKLPYATLRAAQSSPALSNGFTPQSVDVDEWILRNERWLRDHKFADWSVGLVKWSAHSDAVFPMSTNSVNARNIKRAASWGRAILDEMRPNAIQVQPSVDAGMVLSTLSCIDPITQAGDYTSSDLDVYIYGLGPVEANAKISHIFDVWKSNLPEDAKDKTLVVPCPCSLPCVVDHRIDEVFEVLWTFYHSYSMSKVKETQITPTQSSVTCASFLRETAEKREMRQT
ncbi:hypothetical protein BS47DRAFT_1399213 [Hydnum rufescens UP504]|uniref:Uncharacterized protein n=1 Tax=Hydnum rufescens UP504 TaxID=1448309 RepID=A0A9P6AJL2_9AGAM|nr:hypothetical protein BS47DRAFT_1399213 [Hydnum rufescens UP504]